MKRITFFARKGLSVIGKKSERGKDTVLTRHCFEFLKKFRKLLIDSFKIPFSKNTLAVANSIGVLFSER